MRCRRPLGLTTVAVVAVMFVAGCGGGSSPGVANVSSSTSTSSGGSPTQAQLQQEQQAATRFAQCMRSHGMPNFPDPSVAPRAFKNAFNTHSPVFQPAYTACGHLMPAGHATNQNTASTQAQTVGLLAFARCLRSHGFPSFPDPTSSGQLTHEMLAAAKIDLHQPALVQAADACTAVTHGVITKAVVANFIAGH